MMRKTRRAYEKRIQELEQQLALNSIKIYGRDLNEQIARIITRVMDVDSSEFRATISGEVMVLAGMISPETLIRADEAWHNALANVRIPSESDATKEDVVDVINASDDMSDDKIPSELLDTALTTDDNGA